MYGAMHWAERRRSSLPEFKRFSSFPDEFIFAGEFEEGIRQIGNCVPPLFMKAIIDYLRMPKKNSSRILDLSGRLRNCTKGIIAEKSAHSR
jgi:hypothetical protein